MKMLLIKVISSIVLFIIAIIPVFFRSDEIYKSTFLKIFMVLLILIVFLSNIITVFLEKKESELKEIKNKENVDTLLSQLDELKLENLELKRSLDENTDRIKFSAELDNYINYFDVYVIFDKNYRISDLHPTSFGYDFSVYSKGISFTEMYITNDDMISKKGLMLSYKKYDAQRGGNKVIDSMHGSFTHSVSFLKSNIAVIPNTYTIRDVNGGIFSVVIDPNLVKITRRIVFTVNDWVIINLKVTKDMWEKVNDISKLVRWDKYELDKKEYYRIDPKYTMHFHPNPFYIDLFDKKIRKLE